MSETFTADHVREMLRAACEAAGGQSEWARQNGTGYSGVSRFLAGQYNPGKKIEKALGLTRIWRLDSGAKAT